MNVIFIIYGISIFNPEERIVMVVNSAEKANFMIGEFEKDNQWVSLRYEGWQVH